MLPANVKLRWVSGSAHLETGFIRFLDWTDCTIVTQVAA